MDDFLLSIATSNLTLIIVVALLAAALIVGYAPLLKYLPVIGPYVPVARLVAFLMFGALCALIDRRSADARAEIAQLRTDLQFAQVQLWNQHETSDDKDRLAADVRGHVSAISEKVSNYEARINAQPEVAGCFDRVTGDEYRELRAIAERLPKQRKLSNWDRLRGVGRKR